MTTLILYDSLYGNSEQLARAIAAVLGGEGRSAWSGRPAPTHSASRGWTCW
jgi:flavodoxin